MKMKAETLNPIANAIDIAHENKEHDDFRPHMGLSLVGHPCDRYLWLCFRWSVAPAFPGRMRRLFRRGHKEEDTVIDDLRLIGCQLNERQTHIDFGSHVSGSCDGIIESGLPGYENKRLVLEVKTHSSKSFNALVKHKVKESKPLHYIQMQCYMAGLKIPLALYYAVCKDDDRIYTEVVEAEPEVAQKAVERAKQIATSDYMPEPISGDPDWYQCKMCHMHEFCHSSKMTKEANCRTCALSTSDPSSKWLCSKYDDAEIEVQYQRTGCSGHVLHPDLVPWPRMESTSAHEAVYKIGDKLVSNGEPDERVYSSKELIANPEACASGDGIIEQMRAEFDAKIIF